MAVAALNVVTRHRLAGTALAEHLGRELSVHATWHASPESATARTTVFLAFHEEPQSLPRNLMLFEQQGRSVLFVYDGSTRFADALEVATRFGVWSTYDVRDDIKILLDQATSAIEGRPWSQDHLTRKWADALSQQRQQLSPRELEIMQEFCSEESPSPEEIADDLGLSPNTIRTHLSNVRRKLSDRYTGNRQALRTALLERGLIE